MVGLFTPKDNLHAPNESFDLGLMDRAIATFPFKIFHTIAEAIRRSSYLPRVALYLIRVSKCLL